MRRTAARAAALLLAAASARAALIPAAVPPDLSTGPVIADIIIERANVFDPNVKGEDIWMFQMADKIHFVTREKIVRDELLFAPGEHWDALRILESERNMRSGYPYRHAEITPVPRPDGRVDALVRTQDAWTTNPQIGLGTSGGQSSASFGLEENNLFGYGKSIRVSHSEGSSTSGYTRSNSFGYGDPRFLGTRLALNTAYSKSNDADSESVSLTRPFYALDTGRALAVSWSNSNSVGTEVRDGSDYSKYSERNRIVNAEYGLRLNDDRVFVQRVEAGWYANRAIYGQTSESPGTLPGTQPGNVNLSGPTIGYTWIQPHYVKETYIDRMERVEDFNLGNELRTRTGYMARGAGSDEDRWIFNVADQQGFGLGEGRFALAGAAFSGRLFNNKLENGLATANFNFFWKNYLWTRTRTLVAHVEAAQGHRLDLNNQIVLGGSTGLRGYKNDAFVGGRSILMNLEDRFFFDGEYFHLVRFGGAVFVESGSAVPEGSGFSPARFRSDVGAGLRAASTRSTSGGVVRFDVAYALNGGPGGSRWVVSLRGGQAFNFFNSASGGVTTSPGPGL
jgi:outer membrane protein assembly factor BamA